VNSVHCHLNGVLGHEKLKDIWHGEDRNFGTKWTILFEREIKKLFTGVLPVLLKVLNLIEFCSHITEVMKQGSKYMAEKTQ